LYKHKDLISAQTGCLGTDKELSGTKVGY